MFRLRSKSGDESVFRTAEEIRAALLSGFVTPDAQIWDAELKGWVPLLEHALYKQIAAPAPGRKSGSVKGPPSGSTKAIPTVPPAPAAPKAPPKLVIKRPGDAGTTSMPAVKPPVPPVAPPPPPKPAPPTDDMPDLELIDLDLTPDPEPMAAPPPAAPKPVPPPPRVSVPPPAPPSPPAAPPKRPTPAPAPAPEPEPVAAEARTSAPRVTTPRITMGAGMGVAPEEGEAKGGSKKGLIIAAVLVLAAGGGAYAVLGGKQGEVPPAIDSTALAATAPAPVAIDSARADSAGADSTRRDSTASPAPVADTPTTSPASAIVLPPAPTGAETGSPAATTAAAATGPVPFAPVVARGPTPWTARPVVGAPLSLPALEVVRLRYLAAQSRALEQFEAGLEAAGFSDLFNPARVASADKREETLDAVDAGRTALRDFRRRQTAIDFAYTDSMRQALPAGSETPDFRTFGPILRETQAQSALTDSLVGEVAEIYGMLVGETGGYALRGGNLAWKDADNAQRYQGLQERLTAQIARIRTRPAAEVPPAMAAVLRGIGLPR